MNKKLIMFISFILGMILSIDGFSQKDVELAEKYLKQWKIVDSLNYLGLPKSALGEVEKIYLMAKKDKLDDQIIKAIIHRMKFNKEYEEEIFGRYLSDIDKEIAESLQISVKTVENQMTIALKRIGEYLNLHWFKNE